MEILKLYDKKTEISINVFYFKRDTLPHLCLYYVVRQHFNFCYSSSVRIESNDSCRCCFGTWATHYRCSPDIVIIIYYWWNAVKHIRGQMTTL